LFDYFYYKGYPLDADGDYLARTFLLSD
jgi:hypothetical protein